MTRLQPTSSSRPTSAMVPGRVVRRRSGWGIRSCPVEDPRWALSGLPRDGMADGVPREARHLVPAFSWQSPHLWPGPTSSDRSGPRLSPRTRSCGLGGSDHSSSPRPATDLSQPVSKRLQPAGRQAEPQTRPGDITLHRGTTPHPLGLTRDLPGPVGLAELRRQDPPKHDLLDLFQTRISTRVPSLGQLDEGQCAPCHLR